MDNKLDRLVHIFSILGFAPSLCSWVRSFLTDRRITLSFNGEPLPEIVLNHGTPQGSPMSPILSALYILPLLRLAETWQFRSLSSYVDDGAIVATGANHQSIRQRCADGFFIVTDWLLRNGLKVDPDKTEFITFQRRLARPHLVGTRLPFLDLRIPSGGTLQVRRSSNVRYLGVFIDENFKWDTHASIMAARARSSLRGLLLGNSVRGLDFDNWRRVFHAIILPVLLYGLPLWSHHPSRRLVQTLQVAQNEAVRRISGSFRTTPIEPLHNMLAIPPIRFTIAKYRAAFTARLSRLPPTANLRTITSVDRMAFFNPPVLIPTPLTSLLPSSFPTFHIPTGLTWSHPRVHNALTSPKSKPRADTIAQLANQPPAGYTCVHVYPLPHPEHSAAAFLSYIDGTLVERGFKVTHDPVMAAAEAAIAGVLSLGPHPGSDTAIFVPNRTLHKPLFSLTKHKYLPQASAFSSALAMRCFLHPSITTSILPLPTKLNRKPSRADPRIFACKWPGPRGKDFNLAELRTEIQHIRLPPSDAQTPLKALPFCLWAQEQGDCADPPVCPWTGGIIPVPESSAPSDLIRGSLTHGQRRAMSASIQVFFKHCFCGAYSKRFRPTAGDVTTCPCSFSQTPLPMVELDDDSDPRPKAEGNRDLLRGRQGDARPYAVPPQSVSAPPADFESLMAEFADNPRSTPSRSPTPILGGRRRPRPPRAPPNLILHSAPHIIFDCPLLSTFRDNLIRGMSPHTLFWTVKGASALSLFLLRSNSLLRPLPARPDPP